MRRQGSKTTREGPATEPVADAPVRKGIPFKTTAEPGSVKTIPIPRTPGATVWASFYNFFGAFKDDPSSGYSHLFQHLRSIDDVVAKLKGADLEHRVAHLALVGHNEANLAGLPAQGNVTFDPPASDSPLVPASEIRPAHQPAQPTAVKTFGKLTPYLLPDALLSLFSCNSGGGERGDKLLLAVSSILPGRTIVGFCVPVMLGNVGASMPGNACGVVDGVCNPLMDPLTPWGLAAKRACDNKITHKPALERRGPPYHCANPECPTHAKATDDCKGW